MTASSTVPSALISIGEYKAGVLAKDAQTRTSITCTEGDTDYAAAEEIPAGTKYIVVWATAVSVIAVDEATSESVGIPIPANDPRLFPVVFGAEEGDSKVHAQSPSAGAVVHIAYLVS
jgi:hypothetical protein